MRVWLGLCVLVLSTGLFAEPLRIATYNLRNYNSIDRRVEGRWLRDYPKPEAEKAALRQVIISTDPDVLAIQEIGGEPYLRELQRDLRELGLDYPFRYHCDGPDKQRQIAVLSRIEAMQVTAHTDLSFRSQGRAFQVRRGLLELTFPSDSGPWTLFVLHLKSRHTNTESDPESALQREGEARAIRDRIRERHPPQTRPRYGIVGDFNDHVASPPLQRLLQVGDTELTQLYPIEDTRGETWTFYYAKQHRYERVDGFLLSPAMRSFTSEPHGHIYDALPASRLASDHRLVFAEFTF